MKNYTTTDNVAAQLGRTLTDPQIAYLTAIILPAVESWIDEQGGRPYGELTVVAEPLYMTGPVTFLTKTPVTSVTAVRGYYWAQHPSDMQTVTPYWYWVQDLRTGQINLPNWRSYAHLEVDYTPDPTIPANIKLAATMLAGIFMRTVLHPQTDWLTEYGSGQDLRLKFKPTDIPQTIYDLVGGGAAGIVVA